MYVESVGFRFGQRKNAVCSDCILGQVTDDANEIIRVSEALKTSVDFQKSVLLSKKIRWLNHAGFSIYDLTTVRVSAIEKNNEGGQNFSAVYKAFRRYLSKKGG